MPDVGIYALDIMGVTFVQHIPDMLSAVEVNVKVREVAIGCVKLCLRRTIDKPLQPCGILVESNVKAHYLPRLATDLQHYISVLSGFCRLFVLCEMKNLVKLVDFIIGLPTNPHKLRIV